MSYTKEAFAAELEGFLSGPSVEYSKISAWAYETRLRNLPEIDAEVSRWLMQLGAMDMGPEFEFNQEDLKSMVIAARQG